MIRPLVAAELERLLEVLRSPRDATERVGFRLSALVCSRKPKLVAAELGHATSHMVVSNYDSFLDPRTWPGAEEIDRLRAIYGWKRPWNGSASQHPMDTHRVPASKRRKTQHRK